MKKLNIFEIKSPLPLIGWGRELMGNRHGEAVLSLIPERVRQETLFLFDIGEKHYAAFYSEGENLPADMAMKVNVDHKLVKDSTVISSRIGSIMAYDLDASIPYDLEAKN